jgi:cobalt-zinc-cadmium efflux system protein
MSEQHHHPKLEHSDSGLSAVRVGERSRLGWVLGLTALVMAGEFAAYFFTPSLALLNDAFHFLTHFVTMALSWLAVLIACRPAPPDKTYRYWRLEILASLVSGISLSPVSAFVLYEAVDRWIHPPDRLDSRLILILGGVGLGVNAISACLLHAHSKHDHNIRGAFLHLLADSVSSLGVLGAGALIAWKGWTKADPIIAGGISLLILGWCYTLVRDSGRILLESVPRHMNLGEIESAMKGVEGVLEIHDLHVWTITSRMYALTAHVRLRENLPISRTEELAKRLQSLLDERWEINHATFQFEVGPGEELRCERAHEPAGKALPDPRHGPTP